ncbi:MULTISPECIES: SHOCT domain-containing protein [Rhizobium]|uniref:SHOCT domain-containing protein n=1 Tax=Rhizobium TaxID=379 RepID=UPI0019548A62|nr:MULTISPECIES: SHOCT domain-containing protein [Rhizobium]
MFDTFDRNGNAEFPFPKAVVFRAVCQAVKELQGFTAENVDELTARIELKTGMSAFSWGEKITVSVVSSGPGASTISVGSGAKTIFGSATSHGKNKRNVSEIIGQTSKILRACGDRWMAEIITPPTAAPEKGQISVADELTKLAALKNSGVLTEGEFEAQKQRLLSQ